MNCLTCSAPLPPKPEGQPGRRRKYCNRECYANSKPKLERPTECRHCGKSIVQKRTAGMPQLYCDRRCQSASVLQKRKAAKTITCNCKECGGEYTTSNHKQVYCSAECRYAFQKRESLAKSKSFYSSLYPDGTRTVNCGWCGEPRTYEIGKSSVNAFHPDCTIEAQRARYRIKSTKRRTQVSPQRIAADQVVRQYGNACHICGEEIDLSLPRTSRMGLTIDHVIPLAKGGSDEMDNLKPAHWICNNRKSDKLYA